MAPKKQYRYEEVKKLAVGFSKCIPYLISTYPLTPSELPLFLGAAFDWFTLDPHAERFIANDRKRMERFKNLPKIEHHSGG